MYNHEHCAQMRPQWLYVLTIVKKSKFMKANVNLWKQNQFTTATTRSLIVLPLYSYYSVLYHPMIYRLTPTVLWTVLFCISENNTVGSNLTPNLLQISDSGPTVLFWITQSKNHAPGAEKVLKNRVCFRKSEVI